MKDQENLEKSGAGREAGRRTGELPLVAMAWGGCGGGGARVLGADVGGGDGDGDGAGRWRLVGRQVDRPVVEGVQIDGNFCAGTEMLSATLHERTRELCWPMERGPAGAAVGVSGQVLCLWGTAPLRFPVFCAESSSSVVSFFSLKFFFASHLIKNTSIRKLSSEFFKF
jgi:hypothetical protein